MRKPLVSRDKLRRNPPISARGAQLIDESWHSEIVIKGFRLRVLGGYQSLVMVVAKVGFEPIMTDAA